MCAGEGQTAGVMAQEEEGSQGGDDMGGGGQGGVGGEGGRSGAVPI